MQRIGHVLKLMIEARSFKDVFEGTFYRNDTPTAITVILVGGEAPLTTMSIEHPMT